MTSQKNSAKALAEAQKIMDLPSFKILEIEKQGATKRARTPYKHNILPERGSGYAQWEKGGQTHYIGSDTAIYLADESTRHPTITKEYRTDEGVSGSDVAKALMALIMDKIRAFEARRRRTRSQPQQDITFNSSVSIVSNWIRRSAKKLRPTNNLIPYGYGVEGWI